MGNGEGGTDLFHPVTGHEERPETCLREGSAWTLGTGSSLRGRPGTAAASLASGHGPRPLSAEEAFPQCSYTRAGDGLDGLCYSLPALHILWDWDSVEELKPTLALSN